LICLNSDLNITPSRRKLVLKRRAIESDVTKAVILYQPPEKIRSFGRNLTTSNNEQKFIKTLNHSNTTREPTKNSRKRHASSRIYVIFFLIVTIIVISVFVCKAPHHSCLPNSLETDFTIVGNELRKFLYGQNVAINIITETLEEMHATVENIAIFLLYGGQGTGKTWTTHLVSRSLSENVKQIHLHLELLSSQEILNQLENLQCCKWNFLFIEDLDYVSSSKVELIAKLLGKINKRTECPNLKVIVMLISNAGQQELTKVLFQQLQSGLTRQSIELSRLNDSEKLLKSPVVSALNNNHVRLIPVPYFPLGREEVEMCIMQDLRQKRKEMSVSLVQEIMKNIQFFPSKLEFFAVSGCKMVSTKVNMYV